MYAWFETQITRLLAEHANTTTTKI